MKVGINILRPQSVEPNLLDIVVAEYMPSETMPIKPRPASTGPSISLIYRQIRKLRTSVLNFCIFGNDVKYQEFKTAERSEGVLKFGASRYRQIYNLRTLVLKLYIFGSAVLYSSNNISML